MRYYSISLSLTYFTDYNAFQTHPYPKWKDFLHCDGYIIIEHTHLLVYPAVYGHWSYFQVLAIVSKFSIGGYRYLFDIVFSFLSVIDLQMGLLDHMISLFFMIWGSSVLFSRVIEFAFCQQSTGFPFFHTLTLESLKIVILTRDNIMRWYLIVILICFSLLSDAEHVFMYLLDIWISSLEKCLFNAPVHFWLDRFLLLIYTISLCFWMLINPFIKYGLQIFPSIPQIASAFP